MGSHSLWFLGLCHNYFFLSFSFFLLSFPFHFLSLPLPLGITITYNFQDSKAEAGQAGIKSNGITSP